MQENVGNVDRWVRVAVSGALILGGARALRAKGSVVPGLVLAGGAILLETAVTRVCPVNAALRIDTRQRPLGRLDAPRRARNGELSGQGEEDSSHGRKPKAGRKGQPRARRSAT
jgi:hypothetical protein